MQSYPLLKIQDPSGLSDADWAEISRLQRAYSCGGTKSLSKALDELMASDPVRAAKVLGALSPREVREVPEDEMAERGQDDDILELIRKLEILAGE